jgi:hypothetical protein
MQAEILSLPARIILRTSQRLKNIFRLISHFTISFLHNIPVLLKMHPAKLHTYLHKQRRNISTTTTPPLERPNKSTNTLAVTDLTGGYKFTIPTGAVYMQIYDAKLGVGYISPTSDCWFPIAPVYPYLNHTSSNPNVVELLNQAMKTAQVVAGGVGRLSTILNR